MSADNKDGEQHTPLVRLLAVFYFMSSSMMVQFTTKVRGGPRDAARRVQLPPPPARRPRLSISLCLRAAAFVPAWPSSCVMGC